MEVIRLEGLKKEIYIKNLYKSTEKLIKILGNNSNNEWDKLVRDEVINALKQINQLFYFLVYDETKDIVLSNGGLPEFFSYRQLIDDKNKADEKIKSILETEKISYKEELGKKWIDASKKYWENKEDKKNYLLNIIPEEYQSIDYYEKIKSAPLYDITKPIVKILEVINEEKENTYNISWFNYVLGNGVWNIYVARIMESLAKNQLLKDFNKFKIFAKFLEDHLSSGALFLARDIDKIFPTLYPERISMFQLGPNFVEGIVGGLLKAIINDGFLLTAQREDIENSGKNIDKISSGKYIWRADKLVEERFGICSKELENSLREYVRIPNMRLYTLI